MRLCNDNGIVAKFIPKRRKHKTNPYFKPELSPIICQSPKPDPTQKAWPDLQL